mmetsp:Transcript_8105/g.12206  ORF Transcript_8105/g.12206 Transcript_8105/m.12206 type:complete len:628 (-) Transcript_8105:2024-3907(-)
MFQNGVSSYHSSSIITTTCTFSLILVSILTPTTTSFNTATSTHHVATRSNLFRRYDDIHDIHNVHIQGRSSASSKRPLSLYERLRITQRNNRQSSSSPSSSSALNMVFTTPSSVIEQASTKILLDDLIDESVRTTARKTVMMHFNPSSGWIWRRWKGTVFSETWRTCVINMLYALVVTFIYKINQDVFTQGLQGFSVLWGQLLSVTTFTLTFFLNQSYALWRKCYGFSRRLQGRLNDLNMTLAAHAKRLQPNTGAAAVAAVSETKVEVNGAVNGAGQGGENGGSTNRDVKGVRSTPLESIITNDSKFSTYTEPAREVLELMARYTRVFNILCYASFTGSHRPLLTPQGMRRMVDRGIITEPERDILSNAQIPVTQKHNALILWMVRLFEYARQAGHLEGSSGFEQQFLEKCHVIRAQYGAIGDELQGRMPLAYAHIVQVSVDVILWMYPFMALSTGMTPFLSVLGTGLLTMFYQGLFNLAKQFLDPYDNESYGKGEDPLCIDTLIAESNAGSVRWMNGLAEFPIPLDKINNGDLLEYQLPMRGWTIEQTLQREEDARIAQALKEAEEAEKRLAEEAGLVEPVLPLEIDENIEVLMRGDSDDEECVPDENLTMEEALERMEECTEKVP